MAEVSSFKPFARLGSERYWLFRPKNRPDMVYARGITSKKAHYIPKATLKLIGLTKDKLRISSTGLVGMRAGNVWTERWYESNKSIFRPEWITKKPVPPFTLPKPTVIKPAVQRVSPYGESVKQIRASAVGVDESSRIVRNLQRSLAAVGVYKETPTGKFDQATQLALGAAAKSWKLEESPFPLLEGYQLLREIDSPKVYTVNPKTGEYRWVRAEAVSRLPFFDWKKVYVVPPGYVVGRFARGPEWRKVLKEEEVRVPERIEPEVVPKKKFVIAPDVPVDDLLVQFKVPEPKNASIKVEVILPPTFEERIEEELYLPPLAERKYKNILEEDRKGHEKAIKAYKNNSEYHVYKLEETRKSQKSVLDEMAKKGIEINKETGQLDLSKYWKDVIADIANVQNTSTEDEKDLLSDVDRRTKLIDDANKIGDNSSALLKRVEDIKALVIREQRSTTPDEGKLRSYSKDLAELEGKYKINEIKWNDLRARIVGLEETILNKTDKLNTANARFRTGRQPKDWAALMSVMKWYEGQQDKIKQYRSEEVEAVMDLYRLGSFTAKTAANYLGMTPKQFINSLSSEVKDKRKRMLKLGAQLTAVTDAAMVKMYQGTSAVVNNILRIFKDFGKKALIGLGEIAAFPSKISASILTILKDYTYFFEETGKQLLETPSPKALIKMSANERKAYFVNLHHYLLSFPEKKAGAPKDIKEWVVKGAEHLFTEKGWGYFEYVKESLIVEKILPEEFVKSTLGDFALSYLLFTMFDPTYLGGRGMIKAFGLLNKNLFKMIPASQRTITTITRLPGKAAKTIKIKECEMFTGFIAREFGKIFGAPYRATFPKFTPQLHNYLVMLIGDSVDKLLPKTIKKLIQKARAQAVKQDEILDPVIEKRIARWIDKNGGKKESLEKAWKVMKDPKIPDNLKGARMMEVIDPDWAGRFKGLIKTKEGKKIVKALEPTLKEETKLAMKFYKERLRLGEQVPLTYEQDFVVKLLQSEAWSSKTRLKLYDVIKRSLGEKRFKELLEIADESREMFDWLFTIGEIGVKKKGYIRRSKRELARRRAEQQVVLKTDPAWAHHTRETGEVLPLIEGLDSEFRRRIRFLKIKELDNLAQGMGYDKTTLLKFAKMIDTKGAWPEINAFRLRMIDDKASIFKLLKKGQLGQFKRKMLDNLEDEVLVRLQAMGDILTDAQKAAVINELKALRGIAPVKYHFTKVTRKAFGMTPDPITGLAKINKWNLVINGRKTINTPLWLKETLSGAWREKHPLGAERMRWFRHYVLGAPLRVWKWAVLFARPAWYIRNQFDDALRIAITSGDLNTGTWGFYKQALRGRAGYRNLEKISKRLAPEANWVKEAGFWVTEAGKWDITPSTQIAMSWLDEMGVFSKMRRTYLRTKDKIKIGLEGYADDSESGRRMAQWLMHAFNKAKVKAVDQLDWIYKKNTGFGDLALELSEFYKAVPKIRLQIRLIGNKLTAGTATAAQKKFFLNKLTQSKLRDASVIESAFKKVDAVLFDYTDLNKLERGIRQVVPFYGFFSKNFVLWTKSIATQPRLQVAARFYLKSIEATAKDLPEGYKRRQSVWGDWYVLPIFSFQDVLDLWSDPVGEFTKWYKNPNHPIPGVGWNPLITIAIEKVTGKKYWDHTPTLDRFGWTEGMSRKIGVQHIDSSKDGNIFSMYAQMIPLWPVIQEFVKMNNGAIEAYSAIEKNKHWQELFRWGTGANIDKIDDVQRAWKLYWDLEYGKRQAYMNSLGKDVAAEVRKLLYINHLKKWEAAQKKGFTDPVFETWVKSWFWQEQYFWILQTEGKDKANYFKAQNSEVQMAMELRFALRDNSPKKVAQQAMTDKRDTINLFYQLSSKLKSALSDEEQRRIKKEGWKYVTGLDYPLDYTRDDLESDLLNEDGTVKADTIDELLAMIPEKVKKKEWLNKILEESVEAVTTFPEQYYREVIEKDRKSLDWQYANAMRTYVGFYVPPDSPATIEQRAKAKRLALDYFFNLPDWIQARYIREHGPAYDYKRFQYSYLKAMEPMLAPENLNDWYENFYNDQVFAEKFRDFYFIKHPEAKIYYPYARIFSKKMGEDIAMLEKTGIYSDAAWRYLETLPASVRAAWQKAKPEFWENYEFKKKRRDLIQNNKFIEAADWSWAPENKAARERHFTNYPEDRKMWTVQSKYWKMPRDTWMEDHEAIGYVKQNPDYIKWTHRFEVTDEQKEKGKIKDRIRDVKYNIKPYGKGEDFLFEMAKWEKEKNHIYEENPWLEKEYVERITGDAKKKYLLTKEFLELPAYDYEAKQKFLTMHPALRESWYAMAQPWEQKLLDLQSLYFELKTWEEKQAFLKKHPELAQYWESRSLPWSYWFDKKQFAKDKQIVDQIKTAIKNDRFAQLSNIIKKALAFPQTDDERYIANSVYRFVMERWVALGQEDSNLGWQFFNNLPRVLKDMYFERNPEMKGYFSFTGKWHAKLQEDPDTGMIFFNSVINRKWREMYYEKHPEAEKYFAELKIVNSMPKISWEEKRKIRDWWDEHLDLQKWLRRRETPEEKRLRFKKEAYFAILDRIPLTGQGRSYWQKYFEIRGEAADYLEKNSDLAEWLEAIKSDESKILKIQKAYFAIDDLEKRRKYLDENPELKVYWLVNSPPQKRAVIALQEKYFAIPKYAFERRKKFLVDNLELKIYWELSDTPQPEVKKEDDIILKLFENYYQKLVVDTKRGEDAFRLILYGLRDKFFTGQFDSYVKNKLYLMAMEGWIKVINDNFLRGTYYFKHLPSWMRKRYFTAHPEKQFMFQIPLEDLIQEPLKIWEKANPKLAWAYRIMYKYKELKQVPSELKLKVEQIFIKAGVWEDRKNWTRDDWKNYWYRRSLNNYKLKEKDLLRIPKLKEAIQRAAFQYPLKPRPKPLFRKPPRKGWLRPFI